MSWFSSGSRASTTRQLLSLERLETRDCPSSLGIHARPALAALLTPPTSGPQQHVTMVLYPAAILLMFGLLQNGYWSAGGDSEVYLDMARNLAGRDLFVTSIENRNAVLDDPWAQERQRFTLIFRHYQSRLPVPRIGNLIGNRIKDA